MPTFYEEAEFDIEVYEFMSELNSYEIKDVIEYLVDEGHISEDRTSPSNGNKTLNDLEWEETINALSGDTRLRLTATEEAIIKEIAKRFI